MALLPMNASILPPSDDWVFKTILTSDDAKPALIDLLESVLGRKIDDLVVRNNEIPPEGTYEKAVRLDINCKMSDGTQADIEMQARHLEEDSDGEHRNLKGKSLYYLCDLHSSQSSKGVRRYDMLAQTYQITFCAYTVFPDRESYLNTFSVRHDKDNGLLSDSIHLVFVELTKLNEILNKSVDQMTELEKWALFFRYASDERHRNKVNEMIASKATLQITSGILLNLSQDERQRAIYMSRKKYQTDLDSDIATAEDRGRRIGEEIGETRGKAIGQKIGEEIGETRGRKIGEEIGETRGKKLQSVEIAQKMLKGGRPVEEIQEFTGLSISEIESLRKE